MCLGCGVALRPPAMGLLYSGALPVDPCRARRLPIHRLRRMPSGHYGPYLSIVSIPLSPACTNIRACLANHETPLNQLNTRKCATLSSMIQAIMSAQCQSFLRSVLQSSRACPTRPPRSQFVIVWSRMRSQAGDSFGVPPAPNCCHMVPCHTFVSVLGTTGDAPQWRLPPNLPGGGDITPSNHGVCVCVLICVALSLSSCLRARSWA